jgi:hypothetical protein
MQRQAVQRAGQRLEWGDAHRLLFGQGGLHLLLGHRVGQHGMDGKQFQQLADMVFFAGMHEHDHLRLWRKVLQRPERDIQIGDVGAGVIVAPAVNEFPHEKIGRLFLHRPVKIAGRVETLRRNAQLLIQGAEIGVEGGFDQGEKGLHAAAVYMGAR